MKYIFANWKNKLGAKDARELLANLPNVSNLVIFPAIPLLSELATKFPDSQFGAQDITSLEIESFTGEVSANLLTELGIKYALIGHSERRQNLKENNELIKLKISNALKHNIIPVVCIGEEIQDKEDPLPTLTEQLIELPTDLIIAYEPIWAIGAGITPTADEIEARVKFIKSKITCPVLYGGSVNSTNINDLKTIPNIDGLLIGGASTNLEELREIIDITR